MSLRILQKKIEKKQAIISIIGLGYVGLPVACIFAQVGFQVIGLDIKADRVAKINAGISPIEGDEPGLPALLKEMRQTNKLSATTDYNRLAEADVVLIAVDTPVDQDNKPQYQALKSACVSLGAVLTPDTLVIIESTVSPGTVNRIVQPILAEKSGLIANREFYLGSCPERVMPGKLLKNLQQMSRVCGGGTAAVAQTMVALYRHVVEGELDTADIITAELVKTTENTYRDVQIAFANEVAKICEANEADVWRVRALVNKSPGRNMHLPGAGVGGHCIPKDPWLLAHAASEERPLKLIPAARAVNSEMPKHIAEMVIRALTDRGHMVRQARVGVLGYAYLENSDDTRHSPTSSVVTHLQATVSEIHIHDPWVRQYQGDIYERFEGCHALVLMVKHDAYRNLDFERLRDIIRTPILVDGRGLFEPTEVRSFGFAYVGIGRGD